MRITSLPPENRKSERLGNEEQGRAGIPPRHAANIALTLALAFALIVLIYGCPQFNIPGLFKN
jgi:hypothetical protein